MMTFIWCRYTVLACYWFVHVRPSEITKPDHSFLPGPGHCVAQKLGQQPRAQFLKQPQTSKVLLVALQWWPCEAGWGHGPGLCGEWDAVWAQHGVPGPSLPPRWSLQLQHLPRLCRQPHLLRTWGMFLPFSAVCCFWRAPGLVQSASWAWQEASSVTLEVIKLEEFLKRQKEGRHTIQ